MTKTKISDVIVPDVFNPYVVERTAELSALYQSGIISTNAELNRLASSGGTLINMPYWEDLSGEDEVLSDSGALEVDKITAGQDVAALLTRGKAWSVNDLAKALSGDDPMKAIGDLVAAFWARRQQAILISILNGIFGNTATDMDTNKHDISGETGNEGADAVISAGTTLDAIQKLGDAKNRLTAFSMHSAVENKLAKDDLIDYVKPSEGEAEVPYYLGKRVIVDDGCPYDNGVYDTYIFGNGAIGYGEGKAPVPTETDRDSLASDDILINRRHFILHPRGVKWLNANLSDGDGGSNVTPSNTNLANYLNWKRVYEAKNVRIVLFRHKI